MSHDKEAAVSPQLPLTLKLKDTTTFASYFPGPNSEALSYLRRLTGSAWEPSIYLWGEAGAGKSHLLQAVCHALGDRGTAAIYLPMGAADQFPCEALEGVESLGMVCIDDIHLIAGRQPWEMALLNLFERIRERGRGLVVTGAAVPADLGFQLPQLASRLAGGLVLQLRPLSDDDKLAALQLRARRRGLTLTAAAGSYLVRHYGQHMATLFGVLDTLDQASLVAKRPLTIPFMREALRNVPFDQDT